MSQPQTAAKYFEITPREEAILYFLGVFLLYIASWSPPIGAPEVVRTTFAFLTAAVVAIKFELQQLYPPKIPPKTQALFTFIALLLGAVGGQVSAFYATYWYGGLILALIGAFLAAYKDIVGSPAPTAAPAATATSTSA